MAHLDGAELGLDRARRAAHRTANPWLCAVISTLPVRAVLHRLVDAAVPVAELVRAEAERAAEASQLQAVITADKTLTQTRVDALRLVSTSWRGRVGTAALRAKSLKASLTALAAKVHILPLSNLNFLASDGNLTLSVANDLGQEVRGVRVVVQPGNGRPRRGQAGRADHGRGRSPYDDQGARPRRRRRHGPGDRPDPDPRRPARWARRSRCRCTCGRPTPGRSGCSGSRPA